MLAFELTGRWDDLEDIDNPRKLLDYLYEVAGASYVVFDSKLPPEAPGNLRDDQGNPFENFGNLQKMYVPLGLSGTYTICGIDTATNRYPQPTEVALDKQGNAGTIDVIPTMSPFNIMQAVVAWSDAQFEDFPHHYWFEGLDIDPVEHKLYFNMGS